MIGCIYLFYKFHWLHKTKLLSIFSIDIRGAQLETARWNIFFLVDSSDCNSLNFVKYIFWLKTLAVCLVKLLLNEALDCKQSWKLAPAAFYVLFCTIKLLRPFAQFSVFSSGMFANIIIPKKKFFLAEYNPTWQRHESNHRSFRCRFKYIKISRS